MSGEKDVTHADAVKYEIGSSWLAGLVFWRWGQEILAVYFMRKTSKKWRRYQRYLEVKEKTDALQR